MWGQNTYYNKIYHCVVYSKQTDSALLVEGHLMILFSHISGKQCMFLVDLIEQRAAEEHICSSDIHGARELSLPKIT